MAYRYLTDGREMDQPSAENGIYIEGPLSAEDLRVIIGDLVQELCRQVERESKRE
jgi:hypothetical protein